MDEEQRIMYTVRWSGKILSELNLTVKSLQVQLVFIIFQCHYNYVKLLDLDALRSFS